MLEVACDDDDGLFLKGTSLYLEYLAQNYSSEIDDLSVIFSSMIYSIR